MEVVVGNGKMMRQKRINFTRCTKTKSFNRNHAINNNRNSRICRSNSLRSSFKHRNSNKNSQDHIANNKNNELSRSNTSRNSFDEAKNNRNRSQDVSNFLNNNDNYSNHQDEVCFGEFTRDVHDAICGRLGDTLHIPKDSVQPLFNDLKLFPSKSQVTKMLQCARQCGRRNGATDYITFGEFCVFVREMQTQNPKLQRKTSLPKINNKCPNNKCDVFLGGSCNPTTWRADTAIPELQKQGITFYNPQVSFWAPELVAQEYDAKQAASILLFVIDSQTRSTVGMIEVAYLVASGRCVVVVAQPYERGQSIMGEIITDREFRDLVDGQKTLLNLVKSKGVKIHTSLSTALQCTANILRNSSTNGTSTEEQITYKLRKLREVYDSYGGEMNLYNVLEAFEKLTNRSLEISKLYNYFNPQNEYITNSSINFERFCALMAEFSTSDGCDMCTTDVWATQTFQRQCSTNNNTCNFSGTRVDYINDPLKSDGDSTKDVTDIFLGGSLHTEWRWRDQIAVPLIKKHGLIYYNPAVREDSLDEDNGNSGSSVCDGNLDVLEWKRALDRSRVLLMVITNDTRSMTSIILAAFYMGLGKDVVLCVQSLATEGCVIGNETLTKNAVKDYNRARVYLKDLANRKQVPVFENITEAVECAIERCKSR